MDFLFKYIDSIPELPQELIDEIVNHDPNNLSVHRTHNYKKFRSSSKLQSWCKENIKGVVLVAIQEIHANVGPHSDWGRECAINYLVTTGNGKLCHYSSESAMSFGKPNAKTYAPIKSSKEISRVDIQPNRWHIINTEVLHGVVDVTSVRLALTVNIDNGKNYI